MSRNKKNKLEFALTDQSNPLLATGPSVMRCGVVTIEGKEYLLLTTRTSSATLTVSLSKQEAGAWAAEITQKAALMQDAPGNPAG